MTTVSACGKQQGLGLSQPGESNIYGKHPRKLGKHLLGLKNILNRFLLTPKYHLESKNKTDFEVKGYIITLTMTKFQ